jgi:NADP-dependent 3-hydroxy acid dehydrogenase YdfG
MKALEGKVGIVTGAGRGIGRAIAGALAREGAHVVLAARTTSEIDAAAQQIRDAGGSAAAVATDITQTQQVDALARTTLDRYGRADILVNNAGIGFLKPFAELSMSEFDAMWNVNVRGVFAATKAFLPAMTRARSGAIVTIGSLAGKNSFKGGTGYSATKWALRGLTGSLMLEVREYNIRVITIFPGSVATGFSAGGKKGPEIPQPEDVAEAVVFALKAPARAMFSEIDLRPTNP